ncbi:3'-5' exonuclease [Rhizobacter sp. LjRoot28]|uniref:3'-5' exonuclease n=1 Tax=Rhizobacter sp. LjRoot28 TaxID=3342309 RepID=UPI003ECF2654
MHASAHPASGPRFIPETLHPTAEQVAIQTARDKYIVVEANAGAAKTTTLALRMAESAQWGIPPEKIVALTYTLPACDALRGALRRLGVPYETARRFRIGTFEQFASAVLKRIEGGTPELLDTPQALRPHVLQALQHVEDNPEERHPDHLLFPAAGDAMVEEFLQQGMHLKGTMQLDVELAEGSITPDSAEALGRNYALLKAFRIYENQRRRGSVDHPLFRGPGDATYDLAQLIWTDNLEPEAPGWPVGIRTLVLDEMHDMNHSMYVILDRILTSNRDAFFCGAGDRDQVIHKVAGADARFMGDALEDAGRRRVRRFPLTASYRFGPSLACAASRLADKPYASEVPADTAIMAAAYAGPGQCEAAIVAAAQAWQAQGRKARMSEFAVLLRHGHQSVLLENALLQAGLPYVTAGFDSYLVRPEILLVRGLLAVATGDFSSIDDPDTRRRIVEAFVFFGDITISTRDGDETDAIALLRQAVRAVTDDPSILPLFFENQVLRNAAPAVRRRLEAAVAVARAHAGDGLLDAMLAALQPRDLAARVLVGAAALRAVEANLAGLQRSARGHASAMAFFHSLNEAERLQRERRQSDCLVLAQVEATKGLEYDHVVLPYLRHDTFPDRDTPLAEERNLFYVAITRARRKITLLAHADAPSRFLADAGWKLPSGPAAD